VFFDPVNERSDLADSAVGHFNPFFHHNLVGVIKVQCSVHILRFVSVIVNRFFETAITQ
jgi:hypothetical protein